MKKILSFASCALALCAGAPASATEIATIMGSPDASLDFVRELVTERVPLTPGFAAEAQISTEIYSILARRGVLSATSLEIVAANGSTTGAAFSRAIQLAATKAPVVLNIVTGPSENEICAWMAAHPETAFVTIAGANSQYLDASALPACAAENILRVAGLSKDRSRLIPSSNFGPLVRIAAPGSDIRVIGPGERLRKLTHTSVAAALVAGQLVAFARNHGTTHEDGALKGGKLIAKFFKKRSHVAEGLKGLVAEGRALEDTGY